MSIALSERVNLVKVADHTASGTTAVVSASVDLATHQGDSVLFRTSFGTANAGNLLKASGSNDDSAWSDIAGSSVTSGSSDEDVWIDLPRIATAFRYVRVEATRGSASTLESIWADVYDLRSLPADNTTTGTIVGEVIANGAAGTA